MFDSRSSYYDVVDTSLFSIRNPDPLETTHTCGFPFTLGVQILIDRHIAVRALERG